MITDDLNNDLTQQIIPYIGPNENFHDRYIKPSFFNKTKLIIQLSNGTEKVFMENDNINMKQL
jgi:hypothetical protein